MRTNMLFSWSHWREKWRDGMQKWRKAFSNIINTNFVHIDYHCRSFRIWIGVTFCYEGVCFSIYWLFYHAINETEEVKLLVANASVMRVKFCRLIKGNRNLDFIKPEGVIPIILRKNQPLFIFNSFTLIKPPVWPLNFLIAFVNFDSQILPWFIPRTKWER